MNLPEKSLALLEKYVKNESLKRHCLAVAAAMKEYAIKLGLSPEEQEKYWAIGLLHDFDWEIHPDLDRHPVKGAEILRGEGFPDDIINAILGHGNHTGVKRESKMSKVLFSVDELSGLIVALAKVRPENFEGMDANSVEKVIKKKEFAKAVSRDDIEQGILELGADRKEHFEIVISGLRKNSKELGF